MSVKKIPKNDFYLGINVGLITLFYFTMLRVVLFKIKDKGIRAIWLGVCSFALTSVLLVAMFGFTWTYFGKFGLTTLGCLNGSATISFIDSIKISACFNESKPATILDAIYFSFTTFTTLGYGDFSPNSDSGKLLACAEAFLGHVHSVVFIALAMFRIDKNTK